MRGNIDLKKIIFPPDEKFYRCRVIYDKKIQKIEYLPYILKKPKSFMLIESDINYPYKSTNRNDINKLLKQKKYCDDIIIVRNKKLRDSSIANIALFINGLWLTPKEPLLKGTMRAKLLKEKKIFPSNLIINDLKKMEKFAIMNAMIGFLELKIKPTFCYNSKS